MIFLLEDDSRESDTMPERAGPSSEPIEFRIEVEADSSGLYFATSEDLPGLLVTETTTERLVAEIPKVIESIFGYRGRKVVVRPDPSDTSDDPAGKWLAIPDDPQN